MLELTHILPPGSWHGPLARLELDWDHRQKSRQLVRLADGRQAALCLARGQVLHGGDLLAASQDLAVLVLAAAEELSSAACPDPVQLARVCYHLGNRHVAVRVEPGRVLYQRDHVLDDMLRGLGLMPTHLRAPFEPEPGAYKHAHGQGHGQGHAPGHSHGHHHDHGHGPGSGPESASC